MATKPYYVHLDMNQQEIQKASIEKLATDPTGLDLFAGRLWHNTTEDRVKYYNGTTVKAFAVVGDLNKFGEFQGAHDATSGIPTTGSGVSDVTGAADGSIEAGDYWRVSVAGTIAGIEGGSDNLEVGDVIIALVDGASAAANFMALQTNVSLGTLVGTESITIASVPANTPTLVSPSVLSSITSIVKIFDNAGTEIVLAVDSSNNIESNVALTNVVVQVVGNQ